MSSQRLAEISGEEGEEIIGSKVILDEVVRIMKEIGELSGLTGKQKKKLVLQMIEYELELPKIVETMIIHLIDLLIDVEQKKIVFNPNVVVVAKSLFSLTCLGDRK